MIELLRKLFSHQNLDEKGQDLTEYALLVLLIAIVVLIAVAFFGGQSAPSSPDWVPRLVE